MSTNDLRESVGAQRVAKPITEFGNFMDKLKPQLSLALPKHLNSDRMARLAMTAFSTNQALQRCSHQSIAASIMTAAQLGLERKAKPVLSLPEYIAERYGRDSSSPAPGDGQAVAEADRQPGGDRTASPYGPPRPVAKSKRRI